MSSKDTAAVSNTALENYHYAWDKETDTSAIVLGLGSVYNHSYTPNASYRRNYENKEMVFYYIHPIKTGEKITINYNGILTSKELVWFDVK